MIATSFVLVLVGLAALLLGVAEVGREPLAFVYASIGVTLVAALLLAVGVARRRPPRRAAHDAAPPYGIAFPAVDDEDPDEDAWERR